MEISFYAKARIYNQLLVPKYVHQALTNGFTKKEKGRVEGIAGRFLWNDCTERISRLQLKNDIDYGGVNLTDLDCAETDYRLKYLTRLQASQHPAKELNRYVLGEKSGIIGDDNNEPMSEQIEQSARKIGGIYRKTAEFIEERINNKNEREEIVFAEDVYKKIKKNEDTRVNLRYGSRPNWKEIEKIRIDAATTNLNFLVANRAVYTKERLTRHGMTSDPACPLCGKEETLEHLFMECDEANRLWKNWERLFALPTIKRDNIIDMKDIEIPEHKREIYFTAVTLIKQELWRNRCNALYDGVSRSSKRMYVNLQYRMRDLYNYDYRRLNYKKRKKKWSPWRNIYGEKNSTPWTKFQLFGEWRPHGSSLSCA